VRDILDRVLDGAELSLEDAISLCAARGDDLDAVRAAADHLRREQVGDTVGYVINRNINFTNVCVKACRFCAFSRTQRSEQSYFVDLDEVVRRAVEARDLGATEICIQAGLAPGIPGRYYIDLCRAVKSAAPELHIHAFSPEEIKYGASLSGVTFRDYLAALRDVGLGSLPGTSAEILDDGVRARISPGRITTAEWIDVVTTAHRLGIPTTATVMFGHVETDEERMRHLALLRSIQRDTGGFTELVPLSFVHHEAPLFLGRGPRGNDRSVRPGATDDDVIRLYAIARLMLGATFRNLQASWVKQGLPFAARLLHAGANDLGGTLMNESISTAAGASHGQLVSPKMLRAAIREQGRTPVQRNTRYEVLAVDDDTASPLDRIEDAEAAFGSYRRWTSGAVTHRR